MSKLVRGEALALNSDTLSFSLPGTYEHIAGAGFLAYVKMKLPQQHFRCRANRQTKTFSVSGKSQTALLVDLRTLAAKQYIRRSDEA